LDSEKVIVGKSLREREGGKEKVALWFSEKADRFEVISRKASGVLWEPES
jgi:hypothetical protein